MYITITTIPHKAGDTEKVESFLAQFLPRLEKFPGVVAVHNYIRREQEDSTTLLIWESEEARKEYMESPLKQEVDEFTQDLGVSAEREMYPLYYTSMTEKMAVKA